MADHNGLPVKGYQAQPPRRIAIVNANKELEERVLRQIDDIEDGKDCDERWAEIAREHIEQGFMALNRAIFQPERVKLPEDDE